MWPSMNSVEINGSFYALQRRSSLRRGQHRFQRASCLPLSSSGRSMPIGFSPCEEWAQSQQHSDRG
jgi:hypothetical protein